MSPLRAKRDAKSLASPRPTAWPKTAASRRKCPEAGHIGWGVSGRNGSFCCFASDKVSLTGSIKRHGLAETQRYYASQVDAIQLAAALSETEAASRRRWLERRSIEVFPAFHTVETAHFGAAQSRSPAVSLTRDRTPAIGRLPDDESVFYAFGCHGNGVNTMPWAGRRIAGPIGDADRDENLLPAVVRGPAPRFPLPGLRKLYLRAA